MFSFYFEMRFNTLLNLMIHNCIHILCFLIQYRSTKENTFNVYKELNKFLN